MNHNILTSLGPNYENDDVRLALKLLFTPEKWDDKLTVRSFEDKFATLFGNGYKAISVNSGRSGLYLILKALNIGKGDEVILQSFTCIAVPNAITWNGAIPVYVDIGNDLNLDPVDLKKKITSRTKAIIVQHTFGIPAKIEKVQKVAKKNNLVLIEDCAHALGATHKDKLLGSFSDVSFFSFGRDKTISSVFGGMVVTKDEKLYKKLLILQRTLKHPGYFWTAQQLLHPLVMVAVKRSYNWGIGKITLGKLLLITSQKLGLLSFPVYGKEKEGHRPSVFPTKLPAALAILADNQLGKLSRFVNHRRKITTLYRQGLSQKEFGYPTKVKGESLLRFPVVLDKADEIYKDFKSEGILLGNWYNCPVVPCSNGEVTYYKNGSCPKAEEISKKILNLPTYINLAETEAETIVNKLQK